MHGNEKITIIVGNEPPDIVVSKLVDDVNLF